MNFLTIDLGTTNIKVGCYNSTLDQLSMQSVAVNYHRDGSKVEFDPEEYFTGILTAMKNCIRIARISEISRIVLTGQAESLVLLDASGCPVRDAISWLDNRSGQQSAELSGIFDSDECYKITGQVKILTTWPITKMLWLKQNESESFLRTDKYLLLKDYVVFKLTGQMVGEYSIYNFSYYFDVVKKEYWNEILDYVGIKRQQLPPLVEPCTDIATIMSGLAMELSINDTALVNIGTLDHFAGMIGTGNIRPGIVSESTGTVMSVATMIEAPPAVDFPVSFHYGPFKDSYVLLSTCESGGISLEWFKNEFLKNFTYKDLDRKWAEMSIDNSILFLPYLNGANAPDFDENAKGVFYGLNVIHDKYDMSFAIMEGVAHLLANNMEFFEKIGVNSNVVFSTGGGSRSDIWLQLKSDITNKQVFVPQNEEAASTGCAIIGLVSAGVYPSYEEAIGECIKITKSFQPQNTAVARKKHELYNLLLEQMKPVFAFDKQGF